MDDLRYQETLPNANLALALSIISLLTCCCFGVLGFVLALIALVLSNKDLRQYQSDPTRYAPNSYSNLSSAHVLSIISLVLNSAMLLLMVLKMIFAFIFPFEFLNHWIDRVDCW